MLRSSEDMTLNGGTAPVYSDPNLRSPRAIMVPSSLNMMRGAEGRQEGIYASSDQSRTGRSPLQNDLGLTLLPGSQIQQADERSHETANRGGRALHQTPILIEDPKRPSEAEKLLFSESKASETRKGSSSSYNVATGNRWDMSQTLVWIEERRKSLADKEVQASKWNERLPSHRDPLQHVVDSRSRYGLRVRGWKNALQDNRDDLSYKRRKIEMTGLASLGTNKAIVAGASPPGNGAAYPTGNCATPPSTAEYQQHAPPLSPTMAQRCLPNSLTGLYPKCPTRSFRSHEHSTSQSPSLTAFSDSETGQSITSHETMNISREVVYKQMQAELSQTKLDLFSKTRSESDAQQTINDLRKRYDNFCTLADTYAELQKAHSSLLLEFRQVLNLYNSLAHKHSACRGSSSKKLAQRIIESQPPSNDSAYASRSSSTAAPLTFARSREADTVNDCSHLGDPLIDLTTIDMSAPLPAATTPSPILVHGNSTAEQLEPIADQSNTNTEYDDPNYASRSSSIAIPPALTSNRETDIASDYSYLGAPLLDLTTTNMSAPLPAATTPLPNLAHGGSIAEQHEPISDQSNTNTEHDDPNYANINGFDEEANELFNALWEQEMASWDAEQAEEPEA